MGIKSALSCSIEYLNGNAVKILFLRGKIKILEQQSSELLREILFDMFRLARNGFA